MWKVYANEGIPNSATDSFQPHRPVFSQSKILWPPRIISKSDTTELIKAKNLPVNYEQEIFFFEFETLSNDSCFVT
jgi:hypothetical protein